MASQWPSFTRQKLFLASTLFRLAEQQEHAVEREAGIQGGIALLAESRRALLKVIAEIYQVRQQSPETLDALADCIGGERAEVEELRRLAMEPGSWWQQTEQLLGEQQRPTEQKAPAEQENMIAVASQTGPDRSLPALQSTVSDMKMYLEMVVERHDEW
ncbi:hypothetical protein EZI54_00395 [Marinobacter halodurans]|uniref:Uncharacterized protein n=1 Tax=Marinobacter halodurans TaxID=2528979 RepID=A0ABY1ZUX2_9GAMM|nr:DUF6586 family protein [Marinobacter halodurans]TBW59453.1 hypothetical protein EZI54_00395 [Marinobacter halodurans]